MKAILFVDDHEVLARLSCEILEMHGYRAVSAYNGEDALAKFEHHIFAQLADDAVVGNDLTHQGVGALRRAATLLVRNGERGDFYRGMFEEASSLVSRAQQRPGLLLERLVVRARLSQKRIALPGRLLERRIDHALDLFPPFRIHRDSRWSVRDRAMPWRCSNHASP